MSASISNGCSYKACACLVVGGVPGRPWSLHPKLAALHPAGGVFVCLGRQAGRIICVGRNSAPLQCMLLTQRAQPAAVQLPHQCMPMSASTGKSQSSGAHHPGGPSLAAGVWHRHVMVPAEDEAAQACRRASVKQGGRVALGW